MSTCERLMTDAVSFELFRRCGKADRFPLTQPQNYRKLPSYLGNPIRQPVDA